MDWSCTRDGILATSRFWLLPRARAAAERMAKSTSIRPSMRVMREVSDVLIDPVGTTPAKRCAADIHADGSIDEIDLDEFVELLLAQP